MSEKIHIIAEAGTNHNGDVNLAKDLVKIAKESNADSVKFQIINPYGLYLPGQYNYGHYDIKEVLKIRHNSMMTDEEYQSIVDYCNELGIRFSASVFDTKSLDLLLKFNPPYVKIASSDLNNVRFLKEVAERGKKMIISTGMSTLQDIEKSLNVISKTNFDDIILLHCVSVYPSQLEISNLNFITKLKDNFGFEVGFSDHTGNSLASCMALVKGATWFEKHFTTDKNLKGFDHAYAMEANEMKQYVSDLHSGQKALQEPTAKISDKEFYTRKRARRSLYAARNIKAGEIITNNDVLIVRPEGPLNADQIYDIVGKTAIQDIKQHVAFTFDIIK